MSVIHKFGFGFAALVVLCFFAAGQFGLALLSREYAPPPISKKIPVLQEKLSESFVLEASGITVQTGPLKKFQD